MAIEADAFLQLTIAKIRHFFLITINLLPMPALCVNYETSIFDDDINFAAKNENLKRFTQQQSFEHPP